MIWDRLLSRSSISFVSELIFSVSFSISYSADFVSLSEDSTFAFASSISFSISRISADFRRSESSSRSSLRMSSFLSFLVVSSSVLSVVSSSRVCANFSSTSAILLCNIMRWVLRSLISARIPSLRNFSSLICVSSPSILLLTSSISTNALRRLASTSSISLSASSILSTHLDTSPLISSISFLVWICSSSPIFWILDVSCSSSDSSSSSFSRFSSIDCERLPRTSFFASMSLVTDSSSVFASLSFARITKPSNFIFSSFSDWYLTA